MMSAIDRDHGAILFSAANPADEVFGTDTGEKPLKAAFNGKFRAECLNANWFLSLDAPPKDTDVIDLMDALRKSLSQSKTSPATHKRKRAS